MLGLRYSNFQRCNKSDISVITMKQQIDKMGKEMKTIREKKWSFPKIIFFFLDLGFGGRLFLFLN